MKDSIRNFILLISLACCWGPSFLFIRLALDEITPFTLVMFRLVPAALLLWLIVIFTHKKPFDYLKDWRHFLAMGFLSCFFPFCCISASEQYISSSFAAIINSTTPLFTALGAHFLLKDHLSLTKIMGILCGFSGILIVYVPTLIDQKDNNEWGAFLVLLASLGYACGYLYSRKNLSHVPSMIGAASQVLAAAICVIPAAFILENPLAMSMPSPRALLGLAGLTFLGTALAFVLFYKLNKTAGATYTSTSTLLFPAIAVLLGVFVLGEKLEINIILGCAIIFLGLSIANNLIKINLRAKIIITSK